MFDLGMLTIWERRASGSDFPLKSRVIAWMVKHRALDDVERDPRTLAVKIPADSLQLVRAGLQNLVRSLEVDLRLFNSETACNIPGLPVMPHIEDSGPYFRTLDRVSRNCRLPDSVNGPAEFIGLDRVKRMIAVGGGRRRHLLK